MADSTKDFIRDAIYDEIKDDLDFYWGDSVNEIADNHKVDRDTVEELFFMHLETLQKCHNNAKEKKEQAA